MLIASSNSSDKVTAAVTRGGPSHPGQYNAPERPSKPLGGHRWAQPASI